MTLATRTRHTLVLPRLVAAFLALSVRLQMWKGLLVAEGT